MLVVLWAALDNDPALIAECLARPALADRLLHSWFEQDERLAGQTFADWWQVAKDTFTFDLSQPPGSYRLPPLNPILGE